MVGSEIFSSLAVADVMTGLLQEREP